MTNTIKIVIRSPATKKRGLYNLKPKKQTINPITKKIAKIPISKKFNEMKYYVTVIHKHTSFYYKYLIKMFITLSPRVYSCFLSCLQPDGDQYVTYM